MPVYMDTHEGTDLPNELRRTVIRRVQSGEKDDYGVVDHGIVIDREGGEMHCLLEAPNEDAIVKHHQSLNVPLAKETIHEAEFLLK